MSNFKKTAFDQSNEQAIPLAELTQRDSKSEPATGGAPARSQRIEDEKERLYQIKQRLKRGDLGPHRPLAGLVQVEAELQTRSEVLAEIPDPPVDRELLVHQLVRVVDTRYKNSDTTRTLRREAVRQYRALKAADPVESMLNRHIVGMSVGALDSHALALQTSNPKVADIYLRHAEKMTQIFIQLVDLRDRRRSPNQPLVGNVHVGAGGQAIVANIEAQGEERDDGESSFERPERRKARPCS